METNRIGLAVWVNSAKMARHLRKYGNVHYISKRLRYVIMYVDESEVEHTLSKLKKQAYVTEVMLSCKHQLRTEFQNAQPDRAKDYDYRMESS